MNKNKLRTIQLSMLLTMLVGLVAFGVTRVPTQTPAVTKRSAPNVAWPTPDPNLQTDFATSGGVVSHNQLANAHSVTGRAYDEGSQQPPQKPLPIEWDQEPQLTPEPFPTIDIPLPQTNPFIDTSQDHLSTFALDVDTGSYSAARNYIMAGTLPPPGTVRVEEFVNYFRYDYPVPEDKAFGVTIDSALSPFNASTQIVRVGVQAQRISDASRKSAVLTFVIDISGSMAEPNRLPLVKQALRLLVNELRPTDKVAIVVYGSEAKLVLDHTTLQDRAAILAAIDALDNEGSTNAEAGLKMAYELAAKGFDPDSINRVILCSDGVANVGATTPDAIRAAIREYGEQGVYLTTIGFGMGDYNDHLMEQLADDGDGQYAYVDNLAEAKRVFVENLTGTLQVVAKDAKIQVSFNPAVVARYRLIGYENRDIADIDFRNDAVDAGEIGAGHTVTALYEIELTPSLSEETALTVQMRYLDPSTGQATEMSAPFNRAQMGSSFDNASPRFQLAVAASAFAETLKESDFSSQTSLTQLLTIVERIAPQLSRDSDVQEFVELVRRAKDLR